MIEGNTSYQNLINHAGQMVLVLSEDWDESQAVLHCYSREGTSWNLDFAIDPVNIGKNGMAWDAVVKQTETAKNRKKEGDGKTPAGVFGIGLSFGTAQPEEVRFSKLPYLLTNDMIECVDDPASRYYNKIVSRDIVPDVDWNSSEKLLRQDHLYDWAIVIEYNTRNIIPGAGSCIFFHVWRNETAPTAGCTAMPKEAMEKLMGWLDPALSPVVVQLPVAVYKKVGTTWQLPALQ